MFQYLFSFKGRVNRAKMWLYFLVALAWEALCFGAIVVTGLLNGLADPLNSAVPFEAPSTVVEWIGSGVFYLFLALYVWTLAAVSVKRLHDRAKGAIWLLLYWGGCAAAIAAATAEMYYRIGSTRFHFLFEVVLMLIGNVFYWWWFVELFFLRGTRGDNRFGPDPLANGSQAAQG